MKALLLLAAMWVVLVAAAGCLLRPLGRFRRAGRAAPATEPPVGTTLGKRPARRRRELVARVGLVTVAGGTGWLISPVGAVALAGAAWMVPRVIAGRAAARRRAAIADELPDVIELLALAVGSGTSVRGAVDAAGRWGTGSVSDALRAVTADVVDGCRLADRLDELPERLGDDVRPLVAVLVASERYGSPILPALHRLADETRAANRRRADEAVRRLPVRLLFPLVGCILPAFALLTVAPLIAGALGSLRLAHR